MYTSAFAWRKGAHSASSLLIVKLKNIDTEKNFSITFMKHIKMVEGMTYTNFLIAAILCSLQQDLQSGFKLDPMGYFQYENLLASMIIILFK